MNAEIKLMENYLRRYLKRFFEKDYRPGDDEFVIATEIIDAIVKLERFRDKNKIYDSENINTLQTEANDIYKKLRKLYKKAYNLHAI